MKALVQDTYGSAEVMELREIDRPTIDDDQVLLRVVAAGVNPADWAIMSGLPYIARPVYGLPKPKSRVRGSDVAGVVAAVGPAVTRFKVGDEVFGSASGSYAEFAAAAETSLVLKPANISFEGAATVAMAGQVAVLAVIRHGQVRPGQKVLINGASGGIGTFAVQIAKAMGAHVTGVASPRNQELLRSIGADEVIDYTREDFTASGKQYDFILDNVSNHSLTDLRGALTPTGMLVPNGGNFGNRWFAGGGRTVRAVILSKFVGQTLRTFIQSDKLENLEVLRELLAAGKVTPVIDRVFPLAEAHQALDHVGAGHARGKTVVSVAAQPATASIAVAA
jgi:NADPH:quinone reductase-like Zn-dependent oxidoreductase